AERTRIQFLSRLPAWERVPLAVAIGAGGGALALWLVRRVAPGARGGGVPPPEAVPLGGHGVGGGGLSARQVSVEGVGDRERIRARPRRANHSDGRRDRADGVRVVSDHPWSRRAQSADRGGRRCRAGGGIQRAARRFGVCARRSGGQLYAGGFRFDLP